MLTIKYQTRFKRDYRRAKKRGCDPELLKEVIQILIEGKPLPPQYRDHPLAGKYADCRECHITADWLLIYRIDDDELILYAYRTGTHADLFGS